MAGVLSLGQMVMSMRANVNGDRNGWGTYYWPNGDWYEGEWVDGQRTGQGTYHWADGTTSTGPWTNGVDVGWEKETY